MELRLRNKKFNEQRALAFGMILKDGIFRYTTDIVDGMFRMTVDISADGVLYTLLVDRLSGDEYVLHLTDEAVGAFVGRVRAEYNEVLNRIKTACFDDDIFKQEYTLRLIEYAFERYGSRPEFLWEKYENNAVLRRSDTDKWFAVILTVSRRKLGLDSDEIVEIVNLKMKPEELERIVDDELYFRGWHMNKKSWISVILDGSVSFDEIRRLADESYLIAK